MSFVDIRFSEDERGKVVFVEDSELPFDIKRCFWIRPSGSLSRANHANRRCRQCIICLSGSFKLTLDDGVNKKEVILDSDTKGYIIEPSSWRILSDFSSNCVILVLASEPYSNEDYIRDYETFKKEYVK